MFGRERRMADDELVKHATQCVDVRRLAGLPALRSLGGQVVGAADDLPGAVSVVDAVVGNVSDPEIRDLDGPVRRSSRLPGLTSRWTMSSPVSGGQARRRPVR